MLDSSRFLVKQAPRTFDALRGKLLAAIAAGAGLVHGCGGRAQDVADEDTASALGRAGARDGSGSGQAGSSSSRELAPQPRSEPPPRQGETCYSPASIAESIGIDGFINFVPAEAFDENGCLVSDYSGWLTGGGCSYDPRPAVVRGERCCHLVDTDIPGCGRPFVVRGAARTAPARLGAEWVNAAANRMPVPPVPHRPMPALSAELSRQIGREWLADARLEHASVAAFAAFSLSLLSVGAPAELLAASQRAGLDEVEHARACFTLASRFMSETLGPGPLPLAGFEVETELERLVVRTWLDGCVEETMAALVAEAQLDAARDEGVRAALSRIAADEARHAELAWSFVAWALASGGPEIRRALLAARDRAEGVESRATPFDSSPPDPARPDAARPAPTSDAVTLAERRAHGRLSPSEVENVRARAWCDVIRPALDALLANARVEQAAPGARSSGPAALA